MNIAILGQQMGDEGKGRVVHDFSPDYDWVIRFNGGANAGHTIYRDGVKFVHNLMPSFDWRSKRPKAFLGSGMVIDLNQLLKEVEDLYSVNPEAVSRVYVDWNAFIVTEQHKEEDRANNKGIGTTNRGIGPAYRDKIYRKGQRICDVSSSNEYSQLITKLKSLGVNFVDALELYDQMSKSSLLFEGAQGIMIDINHGTYPYVTCSEATIAGAYSSGFTFPISKVYGIGKCYSTRVGEGPFPTEIFGEEANMLREAGNEYGATTGRPRRVGWLDLPALSYACKVGGITDVILTKFDILNNLPIVRIATEYENLVPTSPKHFFTAKPKYTTVPGWKDAKNVEELKLFLDTVTSYTGMNISHISCGTSPDDLIKL